MSADLGSGIFKDLMGYSKKFAPSDVEVITSNKPEKGCDVYHYHRPQLERDLEENSIVTVHHDLNDNDKWHHFKNFEQQYKQAKKIICLNNSQVDFLSKHGIDNTIVIPHGYNENVIKLTTKAFKEKVNIGVISKRYGRKVKGEALLLEIMKRLDRNKICFTFIGKDRTQDCWKARDLGFDAEVFERLPYKLFGSLYESLDALLITSIFEGGPANVPEAVASGTPVFGTSVGMIPDFIDKKSGILLTGNPTEDAKEINAFAINPEIQTAIKNRAYKSSVIAKTWADITQEQMSVYRSILK